MKNKVTSKRIKTMIRKVLEMPESLKKKELLVVIESNFPNELLETQWEISNISKGSLLKIARKQLKDFAAEE